LSSAIFVSVIQQYHSNVISYDSKASRLFAGIAMSIVDEGNGLQTEGGWSEK